MQVSAAQHVVHWEAAAAGIAAAARWADEAGIKVNIAVVDAGGNLAGFLRMPGAFLHSIDIAIDKAYTAAGFGLPTSAWTEALATHSPATPVGCSGRLCPLTVTLWREGLRPLTCTSMRSSDEST